MYKVYLLDDEPFILEGLKYIVEWEELGFEIVGCANNGEDGLYDILTKEIDLVVTDIMMPKMTGLELIKNLKNKNYDTNFIVLSAFQEFEYARDAINMGAESYILKPIDEDELSKSVKSIYNKLKEKEKQNLDKEIVNNNLLFKIITENNSEETDERLEKLGLNNNNKNLCVGIIEFKNSDEKIRNILKDINIDEKISYCIQNRTTALFIVDKDDTDYINTLTSLKNDMISLSKGIVYMSLGKVVDNIKSLDESYKTAKEVSDYKIVYPNISWIKEYREVDESSNIIDIELKELKELLFNKDFSNISSYIQELFIKIKAEDKMHPSKIKIKAIEVFLNVYNHFNESKMIKGLNLYLENTMTKDTVDEIEHELLSMIKYIHIKLENTQECISPIILKLLNNIEQNYQKDINLKEMSESLNINSIYLGQLFQKETGVLFSDYINHFRINKAKDLLVNTSLKASEIGDLVGYSNKNYFYRKFKTVVGVTPSEWRKINI